MTAKVFLSHAYTDHGFVAEVQNRLPGGLAYFYPESFENGELLLKAMERCVSDSAIFVLFASKAALKSKGVLFEIERARLEHTIKKNHKILIFPTEPDLSITDLPEWLQSHWIPKAGYSASDVARYITTVLLEPDIGLSGGAIRVTGRGKTLDKLEQLTADFISRKKKSPNVYILAGFNGIGRKTFAAYYMRRALGGKANLVYGPTLVLSPQAGIFDVYRALRDAVTNRVDYEGLAADFQKFQTEEQDVQLAGIMKLVSHFSSLGQAITISSTEGFLEDKGEPKKWVLPFLSSLPEDATVFIISNRQFSYDWVSRSENCVQLRVEELDDKDIRTLMIFTAEKLRVKDFSVSDEIIRAIGGHADIANAAVKLIDAKGAHILDRDPRLLFNIQNTILGESIRDSVLDSTEKKILYVLSWVPCLGGNLLEKIVCNDDTVTAEQFIGAIEKLILACLITPSGYTYSISSAIRQLFRRWNITPPDLLKTFSQVLSEEWKESRQEGIFRIDLFDAFVFMHVLEGKLIPKELIGLLSPGTLYDVVRETFNRGKDADDEKDLERVAYWGSIADGMTMDDATREEILSTVVRSKIRLNQHEEAEKIIVQMTSRGYRSVSFLRGHMLRRQENYTAAIPVLENAISEHKYSRSAVHELALSYKRTGKVEKLTKLLGDYNYLVQDSAMFTDFQIGIDLARGDLTAAEAGITRLAHMPDDDGKADLRTAQLCIRRNQPVKAKELLGKLIGERAKNPFRLRCLRVIAAAKSGDYSLARQDIDFITKIPGRQTAALRLEARLFIEQDQLSEAQQALDKVLHKSSEDHLLQARLFEKRAELLSIGSEERKELLQKAEKVRAENKFESDFDYED